MFIFKISNITHAFCVESIKSCNSGSITFFVSCLYGKTCWLVYTEKIKLNFSSDLNNIMILF